GIRDFHVTGVQTCALPISGLGELSLLRLRVAAGELSAADLLERGERDALGHAVEVVGAGRPPPPGDVDAEQPSQVVVERAGALRSEERRVGKAWRARGDTE